MRREDGRRADGLEGLVEGQAVVADELGDALDAEEAGVALVGVVDLRRRGAGQARPQAQRADAADAEEQLLLEAGVAAAAVERLGDLAGLLVVAGDVGVEQQQGHAADLRLPDVGVQLAAGGQADGDDGGGAVLLAQQRQREAVGVEHRVGLDLPAVAVERLLEVAGLVEEPDADDRHAEVRRGLQVVAGEDAEAAGVLRQHGRDAELGAEVRDRGGGGLAGGLLLAAPRLVPALVGEVVVQVLVGGHDAPDEVVVGGEGGELVGGQPREELDGVLPRLRPLAGADALEQVAGRRVPGPAQVAREDAETLDAAGQDGADAEASDGLHKGTA